MTGQAERKEGAEAPKYRVFYANIPRDPFSLEHIFIKTLLSDPNTRYPMQFRKGADPQEEIEGETSDYLSVWVDSLYTLKQVSELRSELRSELNEYAVIQIIRACDTGDTDYLYSIVSSPGFIPIPDDDLKKYFMLGVQRRPVDGNRLREVVSRRELQNRYRVYEREGILPADENALIQLLKPIVEFQVYLNPHLDAKNKRVKTDVVVIEQRRVLINKLLDQVLERAVAEPDYEKMHYVDLFELRKKGINLALEMIKELNEFLAEQAAGMSPDEKHYPLVNSVMVMGDRMSDERKDELAAVAQKAFEDLGQLSHSEVMRQALLYRALGNPTMRNRVNLPIALAFLLTTTSFSAEGESWHSDAKIVGKALFKFSNALRDYTDKGFRITIGLDPQET